MRMPTNSAPRGGPTIELREKPIDRLFPLLSQEHLKGQTADWWIDHGLTAPSEEVPESGTWL